MSFGLGVRASAGRCQDSLDAPRPGLEGFGEGGDADLQCVVLKFDFALFERATRFLYPYAIERWSRWYRMVSDDRILGSRRQFISVRIEVSFALCACACACVLVRSFLANLVLLVLGLPVYWTLSCTNARCG